jgi:rhodanese-related sulfurtransferase
MPEEASIDMEPSELAGHRDAGDVQVIDVRRDEEWAEGHLEGSRHIELNEVSAAAESIDRNTPVVFVCAVGNRSTMAAQAFRTAGFEAYSLAGGLEAWGDDGRELVTTD